MSHVWCCVSAGDGGLGGTVLCFCSRHLLCASSGSFQQCGTAWLGHRLGEGGFKREEKGRLGQV